MDRRKLAVIQLYRRLFEVRCSGSGASGSSVRYLSASSNVQNTKSSNASIFDRRAKMRQRDWAARQDDFTVYRYLKDEMGFRVADKIYDLTKFSEVCLDLGCGAGHMAPHVFKENVGCLIQADMSGGMLDVASTSEEVHTVRVVCDEELVPFRRESVDLIITSLSAHWINDLPGWFRRCYEVLRPDGVMIGAMLSGDTLYELRCSLQLAEVERLGGVGSHMSPVAQAQDIGSLLSGAGFDMVTLDSDQLVVNYPNSYALMHDLQGMAESNATFTRANTISKHVLLAADAIYRAMYGKEADDKCVSYPATFQVLSFIGWRPGPNMPKAAKRGSQQVSFKDLSSFMENPNSYTTTTNGDKH